MTTPIKLTDDEVRHLLTLPDAARALASYNRLRAARLTTDLKHAVDYLARARMFEKIERRRGL